MREHWFWFILASVSTVWYMTITVYIAYKGIFDIKNMLRDLNKDHAKGEIRK